MLTPSQKKREIRDGRMIKPIKLIKFDNFFYIIITTESTSKTTGRFPFVIWILAEEYYKTIWRWQIK